MKKALHIASLVLVLLGLAAALSIAGVSGEITEGTQEPSASSSSGELEFGEAPIPEENIVKVERSEGSGRMWGWVLLSIASSVGGVAGISWMTIRRFSDRARLPLTVAGLPGSARIMLILVLLIFGLVHLFGMTTAYIMSQIVNASAAEYFFYMKIGKLTGMSHAHLFGMTVMHLVVAMAFLLTTVREPLKVILITATIAGSPVDIASWWLIKYVSPLFEALAFLGETTSEIGYLTMMVITLYQLWRVERLDEKEEAK
ncbi:MAG: hypothetical protein WAO55_15915 [Candidatus Manganitrophaceae bacterium]